MIDWLSVDWAIDWLNIVYVYTEIIRTCNCGSFSEYCYIVISSLDDACRSCPLNLKKTKSKKKKKNDNDNQQHQSTASDSKRQQASTGTKSCITILHAGCHITGWPWVMVDWCKTGKGSDDRWTDDWLIERLIERWLINNCVSGTGRSTYAWWLSQHLTSWTQPYKIERLKSWRPAGINL
jgi:hypothetical protein